MACHPWPGTTGLMALALSLAAMNAVSQPPSGKSADALEAARPAVEKRLAQQTMFRDVRVTATRIKKVAEISVTFRSVEPLSPTENVRDVFALVWQALTKAKAFGAVDQIRVAGTGARPYTATCSAKVVAASYGDLSLERCTRE